MWTINLCGTRSWNLHWTLVPVVLRTRAVIKGTEVVVLEESLAFNFLQY